MHWPTETFAMRARRQCDAFRVFSMPIPFETEIIMV